jgi:hypothetical protein
LQTRECSPSQILRKRHPQPGERADRHGCGCRAAHGEYLRILIPNSKIHEAIARMLSKYKCDGLNDYMNALREILQEVALLGLWRSKFFEKGAVYGGTALRILYGLDRFYEDIDFTLLEPFDAFEPSSYTAFLQKEIKGFGFEVQVERIDKAVQPPVQSAFLKANTRNLFTIFLPVRHKRR